MQIREGNVVQVACTCGIGSRTSRCLSPCNPGTINKIEVGLVDEHFEELRAKVRAVEKEPAAKLGVMLSNICGELAYYMVLNRLHRELHNTRLDIVEGALANEEPEREPYEQPAVYKAIGFIWGEMCAEMDDGNDPRQIELPVLVARWQACNEKAQIDAREHAERHLRAVHPAPEAPAIPRHDVNETAEQNMKALYTDIERESDPRTRVDHVSISMLANMMKGVYRVFASERQRTARLERQIKALHDASDSDTRARFTNRTGRGERL